jgi:hypothetical protein
MNPGLRGEKPATKRFSHGTTIVDILTDTVIAGSDPHGLVDKHLLRFFLVGEDTYQFRVGAS